LFYKQSCCLFRPRLLLLLLLQKFLIMLSLHLQLL
jgi:hypothetical protein